jgi:hypothetical protein
MGVVDWRAWTSQSGGTMPTAPNPPGEPRTRGVAFPGIGPIPDLISGASSIPTYSDTPVTIKPQDPFTLTTGGPGTAYITDPRYVNTWAWTAQVERNQKIMRPVVAGITS